MEINYSNTFESPAGYGRERAKLANRLVLEITRQRIRLQIIEREVKFLCGVKRSVLEETLALDKLGALDEARLDWNKREAECDCESSHNHQTLHNKRNMHDK